MQCLFGFSQVHVSKEIEKTWVNPKRHSVDTLTCNCHLLVLTGRIETGTAWCRCQRTDYTEYQQWPWDMDGKISGNKKIQLYMNNIQKH